MYKDKEARRLYAKEWRKRNPQKCAIYKKRSTFLNKEKIAAYHRAYRKTHREEFLMRKREWSAKNPLRTKFYSSKNSAKSRGHSFELTFEQFAELVTDRFCYYCNQDKRVGLDRVVNSLGYRLDNVVPCCKWCNTQKGKMSQSRFLKLCISIAKNFNYSSG